MLAEAQGSSLYQHFAVVLEDFRVQGDRTAGCGRGRPRDLCVGSLSGAGRSHQLKVLFPIATQVLEAFRVESDRTLHSPKPFLACVLC